MMTAISWILCAALAALVQLVAAADHNCTLIGHDGGLWASCRHLDYKQIPDDLPASNITLLDFTGNALEQLTDGMFRDFTALKTLALTSNPIKN